MNTVMQKADNTNLTFGSYGDIETLSKRIKLMVKGGDKLTPNEAMALAQVASVTHLNPFIGEVWYIPGKGPMVGIAGARRLEQERTSGQGGYSWPIVTPCAPEEAGATEIEIKDVVAAFKVEINNSAATADYQRLFSATLEAVRGAGVADPFAAAKEICGPRPVWVGYGYSKKTDQSTMNKMQLARKRAEADALKKCIVIPFGAQVADTEVSPAYLDVQATDIKVTRTEADNMRELGIQTGAPEWEGTPEEWETEPPKQQAENPDPIDDKAWDKWLALCHRAEKVDVRYALVDRKNTTKSDLRAGYNELLQFVKDAEQQAKGQPA